MSFSSPRKKKSTQQLNQYHDIITATCNGWTNKVIELAEIGVNLNVKTETGITPLHIAAVSGYNTIVKVLINCGADVNYRENKYLTTPLHFAAMITYVTNVQNLIELNREIADRGCGIAVDLMLTEELKYSAENYEAVIVTLVRKGADLNARDINGKTPLHLAVYHHSVAVKVLLGLGADVDAHDNEGRLPWHYAVDRNNAEAFRWLLAFGADINDFDMFCKSDRNKINFMMVTRSSDMRYLMLAQLTRLRTAGLSVSNVYAMYAHPANHDYHKKCEREVKRMICYEIESGVSLYDLLHMNPRRKKAYINDSEKTKSMLIKFEKEFPNYYGIIRACFYDENKRKPLIKSAKAAWYHLTNIGLPDICVENILSYLNSFYLKVMIEGAKHCKALK